MKRRNPYRDPHCALHEHAARMLSQNRNPFDTLEEERASRWKVARWVIDNLPTSMDVWLDASDCPRYRHDMRRRIACLIRRDHEARQTTPPPREKAA